MREKETEKGLRERDVRETCDGGESDLNTEREVIERDV